jgi:cytoskeleton protein RodZ
VTRPEAEIAELPTDPGARLRRQRELAGLSEQRAAEQLNLDAGAVTALESNDYAALGAPVFVRGHLRRYAALLGLPGDEILGAYDRSRDQLAQPTLVPKSRAEMLPPRGRVISPWLVGGALAFLAAAGIAAYLSAYGLRLPVMVDVRGTDASAGTTSLADAGPASAAGQAATGAPRDGAAPQGGGAATPVPPGQVGLVFEFTTDSWTEVYDGSGRTVLYDLGKAGTRRAVAGVAPFSITLGNAPGVSLTVGGRRVNLPVPPSGETVVRFGIDADGTPR